MFIAVASGKGGTGKTIVSTSLALVAKKCTYIDLDVEEPNGHILLKPEIEKEIPFNLKIPKIDEHVCTFCGKCADACVYNAISIIPDLKKALFYPDLCHSCGHCTYVCPVNGAMEEVDREIGKIRLGISKDIKFIEGRIDVGVISGVPIISWIVNNHIDFNEINIVDSAPGTSCPVVESVKKSDYIMLVTEPTPFGLSDLKLAVEIVKNMGKKAGIIVNKDRGKNIIDDYAKTVNIPILLKIPYSIEIQESYSKGVPLVEAMPEMKGKFGELIDKIICENGKN